MRRIACAALTATTTAVAGMGGSASQADTARTTIVPYVEVDQILSTRLSGRDLNDDTVTYTTVAAGVDAAIRRRRVEVGLTYRYEHQFAWSHNYRDADRHEGLARADVHVVPNLLDLEAGAIATRTRYDIRGAAPNPNVGNPANITQIYSGYLGPSLARRVGVLDVTAAYRFGYTKVDDQTNYGLPTGAIGFGGYGGYGHSTSHLATASVGTRPGTMLPFGWTVSGAYSREDVSQLDQRFTDKLVRLDLVQPVSPTLALTGGIGYESLLAAQDAPLIGADGFPVLTEKGRYIVDPTLPRLIAYDNSGLYYDVGIIWRPSRRTTLVASVGKRYGGLSVTGSFVHQITPSSVVQIGVFNVIDSFGRSLDRNLAALPTAFIVPRNPFTNSIDGCVFSTDPTAGAGGCLGDSFQSINSANYRSRGAYALYSAGRGPIRLGFGAGYTQRRYLVPAYYTALNGTTDRSWYAQGNMAMQLGPRTNWENVIQLDYYEPGTAYTRNVLAGSATSALYRNFTNRLIGTAAIGVYAYDQRRYGTQVTGQLLLGVRYRF